MAEEWINSLSLEHRRHRKRVEEEEVDQEAGDDVFAAVGGAHGA